LEEHIACSLYSKRHPATSPPWQDPLQAPRGSREERTGGLTPNGVVIDLKGAHTLREGRTSAGAAFLVELGARQSGTPSALRTDWLGIYGLIIGMLRRDAYTFWPKTVAA